MDRVFLVLIKKCPIQSDKNHLIFDNRSQVKQYNELKTAEEYATKASDFTEKDKEKLKNLEKIVEKNKQIYMLHKVLELYNTTNIPKNRFKIQNPNIKNFREKEIYFSRDGSDVEEELGEVRFNSAPDAETVIKILQTSNNSYKMDYENVEDGNIASFKFHGSLDSWGEDLTKDEVVKKIKELEKDAWKGDKAEGYQKILSRKTTIPKL